MPSFVRVFITMLLLVAGSPSFAQALALDDVVPGHPDVRVVSLLRQIIPNLEGKNEGATGTMPALRHIGGDSWGANPPSRLDLSPATVVTFVSGGQSYVALEARLGHGEDRVEATDLLALFDAATLTLVDAVDVGLDQRSSFASVPTVQAGEGEDLLVTYSTHHNSNQSYVATALIQLLNGRLEPVDVIDTFSDRGCSWSHSQWVELTPGSTTDGRPSIRATVTDELVATEEECGEEARPAEPFLRTVSVVYSHDPETGRYRPDSDAFERLAEENLDRF